MATKSKEGRRSVRELRRDAPKGTGWRLSGRPTPTSHGYWCGFRRCAAKNLVGIEAIAVYYGERGGQNGNPCLSASIAISSSMVPETKMKGTSGRIWWAIFNADRPSKEGSV
jgi:hypothetical protein